MSPQVEHDHDIQVEEEVASAPRFRVVMINDDYTPMDFVVEVLISVFSLTPDEAVQVMWAIHETGKGVCGVFSYEIAEAKVYQVSILAKEEGHPLLCQVEAA